jgi:chromosome segregation and condensation protein ScpB
MARLARLARGALTAEFCWQQNLKGARLPMPRLNSIQTGIGADLRRHRKAQRKSLQDVADDSGVSLPFLSEIERGLKTPSSAKLAAIKKALGLAAPLPSEMSAKPIPLPGDAKAHLGACLLVAGEAGVPLGRLADAIGIDISAIRPVLRELEEEVTTLGMVILDDGTTARLESHPAEAEMVRAVLAPRRTPGLTPKQYQVLSIVVMLEAATHADVRNARGVESHDHLEALVDRGYLERVVLRELPGRPSRYVPAHRALQELGFSTFEELRAHLLQAHGATSWDEVRVRLQGAIEEAREPVDEADDAEPEAAGGP